MKLNWDSLIDPLFLFMLYLTAGTLWVIIPFPPPATRPVAAAPLPAETPASKPVAEPGPPPSNLAASERLRDELRQALEEAQRNLDAAARHKAQTETRIREEEDRVKGLEQTKQGLEDKLTGFQGSGNRMPRPSDADAARLEELASEKQKELARLAGRLNELANVDAVRVPCVTDKRPAFVELVYNRVVPVTPEFFSARTVFAVDGMRLVQERKVKGPLAGESIDQVRKPGSAFAKLLRQVDQQKEFVVFLLNDDSFAAFGVVQELVAAASGLGFGWEPYDSKDGLIVVGGSGGRRPREQR